MTTPPNPSETPSQQTASRHPGWIVGALCAVVVVLAAVVVVLVARRGEQPSASASLVAATTTTTTATAVATSTEDYAPNRQPVDQAVAMDGVPVDWTATGGDAYDFVSHMCNLMSVYPGGVNEINWKTLPVPGLMTPGGMRALVAGVPYQCPQFSPTINLVYNSFFGG